MAGHAWLIPLLVLAAAAPVAAAPTPEDRGLAIAREIERRDAGWGDQRARMTMVLRDPDGSEVTRRLRVRALEVEGDGDLGLAVFESPPDVRGTALLTHAHVGRPDDQWLYLPAFRRVKRIASTNRAGPFVGSEFAYEDLASQELERYRYRWLRDETLDGRETFVLERVPAYEHSGYRRQVVWVDARIYQPLRIDFYDHRDERIKTLRLLDYRAYLERHWRPGRLEMVDHRTGRSTTLVVDGYRLRTGLTARDFDRNALARLR